MHHYSLKKSAKTPLDIIIELTDVGTKDENAFHENLLVRFHYPEPLQALFRPKADLVSLRPATR